MRFVFGSRTLAMGLVFAVAGFCYAFSSRSVDGGPAASRVVGSSVTLRFTNPLLTGFTNEYDLGDACFGSTDARLVTRYITAEGGLRPYRFTSTGPQGLQAVLSGTLSSLQLGISGVLAGTMPFSLAPSAKTATGVPGIRFQVQLNDARGTGANSATGFFNLALINCTPTLFRFAIDRVPDARLAATYVSNIEVIGGTAPYTFSVVSVAGAGVASMDDLGLFVANDGTIMGNPLVEGVFSITVRCVDAKGAVALNRANTAPNQTISLTVRANTVTSSDMVTTACSVRGDRAGVGKDILKYTGFVNALGQDNFDLLNSEFAFRLGNVIVNGRFDRRSQFKTTLADGSKVKAKFSSSKGVLDINISKGTFATALNAAALVDGAITRKILQITVGDAVIASEVLDFETSVRGNKYGLNYKFGRDGSNAAGAFQIIKVQGKDSVSSGGAVGDAWKVSWLAAPRNAIKTAGTPGLDNVSAVTVRIGENFVQRPATITSRGGNTSFKGVGDGVKRFSMASKSGKGSLQTNVIGVRTTGIPLAQNAPAFGNLFFPLGMDLTRAGAPFSGEHARRIFGLKNKYRDVPPKR